MKILLLDSEKEILKNLEAILSQLKFSVQFFSGAEPALAYIAKENIDIVICDIEMEGMNATTFIDQIEEHEKKVVIFSGHKEIKPTLQKKVLKCFQKPLEIENLIEFLEKQALRTGNVRIYRD